MRRIFLLLLLIPAFSLLGFSQSELIFRRNGAGLWIEEGRKSELIVILDMRRQRGDQLTLVIRPINGIPRRFSGEVSSRDDSSYTVTISSSEKSKASGLIYVANDPEQSVRFVVGFAQLEGRKVAFHFTKERPLRWNALAFGSGVLSAGDHRADIQLASVVSTQNGPTEVSLVLQDGTVKSFVASRANSSESHNLELAVESSESTGTIKIQRNRAKHGIERIEGQMRVAEIPIEFSFTAER